MPNTPYKIDGISIISGKGRCHYTGLAIESKDYLYEIRKYKDGMIVKGVNHLFVKEFPSSILAKKLEDVFERIEKKNG